MFNSLKTEITDLLDLSRDALHIHLGLAIYFVAMAAFRRGPTSVLPWLVVLGFEVINEFLDTYHEVDVRGAIVAVADNDWPALLVLLVCGWALLNKAGRIPSGRGNPLLFAMVIGTLGKFASFPLPDDRFYFVTIGGMAVLMAIYWRPRFDFAAGGAPAGRLG